MQKWIVIGVAVTAVILVVFIVCAYLFPGWRQATADIAIILLALTGMIAAILAIAILFAILYTVNKIRSVTTDVVVPQVAVLRTKVDGILDSVNSVADTARSSATTVSTTTSYASEQVVTPIIKLAGLIAGVRAGATFLARRGAPDQD